MGSTQDLNYASKLEELAEEVGYWIARSGSILVFGAEKDYDSLSTAASRGAKKAGGLIVAIAQDWKTMEVLMQGYMSAESWEQTLKTGTAWYWSTSRQELWNKGSTSGDYQRIKGIKIDCDRDSVLLLVEQRGKGACHTGNYSCFYGTVE